MYITKHAGFIELKEIKKLLGISHERRIVNVYLDADQDRLVIEFEGGRRLGDAEEFHVSSEGVKYYSNSKKLNRDRQTELLKQNGRIVDKRLEEF